MTSSLLAFLFDNDGVLIDSSELHWQAWQLLMKEDPNLSMTHEQFENGFGKRNDLILKEVAPQASAEQHRIWAERKEELFRKIAKGNVSLLNGMESFLKAVAARNIPRIIASSTPPANLEMYLQSTVLGTYFDHFISGEQVPNGKPAPDVFIEAANRLSALPRNCIVFEDAPAGIDAGKSAGCFVVALGTTHDQDELFGYDLYYPSADLLDLDMILKAYINWRKFRLFRYISGVVLVVLGFAGLFLPVMPGLLFLALGGYLLNIGWIKQLYKRLKSTKKSKTGRK